MAAPTVPDLISVDVPRGQRVLVISDMHLWPKPNDASKWAAPQVARVLDEWQGPGLLVLAGDILEMWFVQPPDPEGSFSAHPEFAGAVRRFAEAEGRRVIYLVGNHDGRLGWDQKAIDVVREQLHAELAFAAELTIEGERKVRIEHGHEYDPANEFVDPRDPGETPLGQHIVQEILPSMTFAEEGWLDGVESLADPRTFPAFLTSRLFYRRVLHDAKWLLLPVLLFLVVRVPITYLFLAGTGEDVLPRLTRRLVVVDALFIFFVMVVAGILLWGVRRAWKTASSAVAAERGRTQNDNTRAAAQKFVDRGYAGMICGHTHHPELCELEGGFYANTGSCTKVVDRVDARFQLPHVFVPRIQVSYLELEAGDGWTVRLTEGRRDVPGSTLAEKRVEKRRARFAPGPSVVGVYPGGPFTA